MRQLVETVASAWLPQNSRNKDSMYWSRTIVSKWCHGVEVGVEVGARGSIVLVVAVVAVVAGVEVDFIVAVDLSRRAWSRRACIA